MSKLEVVLVVGTRPNFMKAAPVLRALRGARGAVPRLVHTGQHHDFRMSRAVFRDLNLPGPEVNLRVGGGSHAEVTGRVMTGIEKLLLRRRPHLVLVFGDVNSTLGATLAAAKLGIAVGHVEAGLRSGDRDMPEEINRLCTDHLSELLFASEPSAVTNLRAEGIPREKIRHVGNCMIDSLLAHRERARALGAHHERGLPDGGYALVTLHRPSNVDDARVLRGLLGALGKISRRLPVIWPVHPRTRGNLKRFGLLSRLAAFPALRIEPPLSYLEFLGLMDRSRMMLTDSGGVQEETTILGIPCLTLRANTERPITLTRGTNRLVGSHPASVLRAAAEILDSKMPRGRRPRLWDGRAGERVAKICLSWHRKTKPELRRV